MRVATHFILAAAITAVAVFASPDAQACPKHRFDFGHHFGFVHHYGYGHYYRRHHHGSQHNHKRHEYGKRAYEALAVDAQAAQPAPTTTTTDKSSGCRDLTTTMRVDGEERTPNGIACRQGDGTWQMAN